MVLMSMLVLPSVSACENDVYSCESWSDCDTGTCICPHGDPYCDYSCGQCSCLSNKDCSNGVYACSNENAPVKK